MNTQYNSYSSSHTAIHLKEETGLKAAFENVIIQIGSNSGTVVSNN